MSLVGLTAQAILNMRYILFFTLGILSAFLSWMPIILVNIIDILKPFQGINILLSGVIFGGVLVFALKLDGTKFKYSLLKTSVVIMLFSIVGWILALISSTIGPDFLLIRTGQEFHAKLFSILIPSFVGAFFIGLAVFLTSQSSSFNSKCASLFILVSGGFSAVLYSALIGYVVPLLIKSLSFVTGLSEYMLLESAGLLFLYLVWQGILFSALPILRESY